MPDVKSSMTRNPVTVNIAASLEEAASLMESRGFRHLPVTNDVGSIVGILSDRDVQRARHPGQMRAPTTGDVSTFMSWPVITVHQDMPLREAAQAMIKEKISALLVTDDTKNIVGILTTEDLLQKLVEILPGTSALDKVSYSPVVGELLREVQASGL
ncbi:MAG: CBS domain-containing protein [Bdellovibrionota bacterium]